MGRVRRRCHATQLDQAGLGCIQVFSRVSLEFLCASSTAEVIALAVVFDLSLGLLGHDLHPAHWIDKCRALIFRLSHMYQPFKVAPASRRLSCRYLAHTSERFLGR